MEELVGNLKQNVIQLRKDVKALQDQQHTGTTDTEFSGIHEYARRYTPDAKQFGWFLPELKFDLNSKITLNDDNVILNPHYILAKNIFSPDMVEKAVMSQKKCLDEEHTEHREFGSANHAADYYISGHQVTFMDDCVDDEVYSFVKNVSVAMLKYLQQYTMDKLKELNEMELKGIREYVTDNWLYDWQKYISLENHLDARVIEHIAYGDGGNLGWHTDDGSNLTIVTMLNDANSFEGGSNKFRLNFWDHNEYEVKLQQYDMIMFPSIADHAVTPVSNGERHVMVFEWWNLGRCARVGRRTIEDHTHYMSPSADWRHCSEHEVPADVASIVIQGKFF
eukprot:316656_1